MAKKKQFADDLDQGKNAEQEKEAQSINQYDSLHDKWNDIQDAYIKKYPELETEELFFEGGGFEGLLEKISEIREKPVKEIRTEIENW